MSDVLSNNGDEQQIHNDDEVVKRDVAEEFKQSVVEWVKIDDEIRTLNRKVKELKTSKKEFEQFILSYMENINENIIAISDGKLRRNVSQTKSALKHETIQNALVDFTSNTEEAFKLTQYILNKRPTVERVNLKRTSKRNKPTQQNVV